LRGCHSRAARGAGPRFLPGPDGPRLRAHGRQPGAARAVALCQEKSVIRRSLQAALAAFVLTGGVAAQTRPAPRPAPAGADASAKAAAPVGAEASAKAVQVRAS